MVRCRIAMPEVVSSNPGRGKNKFTKVMGSEIVNTYLCSVCPMLSMRSIMVSDCFISYGMCGVNLALV